ncbi:tRNA-uridine aminocarboxypropyltransferase [Vibrio pectenicida]|uniref:tRNA-uridine aminocarboxypropyltransferase n=1 Tax=Vibrio pectenicida TaxID=62763 RepID=UPI003B9AB43B
MSRYCLKCGKSTKACICQWIYSLASSVDLIILQHPTEAKKPMGTAKILKLSLASSYLFQGEDFTQHEELNCLLSDAECQHFILYPSDLSVSVSQVRQAIGYQRKVRIILLDGTWKKAYKIWQLSKNLKGLPMIHLPKDLKGNYRIRKAPSDNSLSTVEAGYHILSLLEPERDFSALLDTFNCMIDFQIKHMPPGTFEKNHS